MCTRASSPSPSSGSLPNAAWSSAYAASAVPSRSASALGANAAASTKSRLSGPPPSPRQWHLRISSPAGDSADGSTPGISRAPWARSAPHSGFICCTSSAAGFGGFGSSASSSGTPAASRTSRAAARTAVSAVAGGTVEASSNLFAVPASTHTTTLRCRTTSLWVVGPPR
ncbi:hypothetical protein ACHZ98_29740 [Streptomyces sp. MAR4 CNY-716]